uniref:Peptidase C14, caspase catalytic subunit p20 n=1 Tax=Rhodopseudomonas palustris (strain BisA53) TaxID=316055 RepID=Q07IV2_RHOP5
MRLWFRLLCVAAGMLLWLGVAPAQAQSRAQLGPLCTSDATPAEQQIDACNKIIALKVFSGAKLASVYFWRAVGWNKKGQYDRVIADATEALRLQPGNVALYNLRGSAYFDKGEYDIAIADFDDALRLGGASGIVYHNRGNAFRRKGDYARAIADYDSAIRLSPTEAHAWENRGASKQALGDLDGALADINQAIRLAPALPSPLISRAVIWRAKRDFDRAVIDSSEAIRLAKLRPPEKVLTPPNSVLILAHVQRGIAYEVKGDLARARDDYAASAAVTASDVGSKANQATAKVRLALLSDPRLPQGRPAVAMRSAEPRKDAAPEQAAPAAAERRVALVIGNGGYRLVKPLPNAVADAREIAGHLRALGFEVVEGIDLDHDSMQAMTRDFLRQAARAPLALMYYAGHGIQIDGRNFLVPVDQELSSTANPLQTMIDMDSILAGLDDQLRTNILIFDACRNNPLSQRLASAEPSRSIQGESGLAAPVTPGSGAMLGAGTLIAFATAPGQVALDGEGAHSPFAAALARHIGTPGLEVQQMLTRVRAEVVAATRSRQVPWSNSSLLGEVYLGGK